MLYKTEKKETEELVLKEEVKELFKKHNVRQSLMNDTMFVINEVANIYLDSQKAKENHWTERVFSIQLSQSFSINNKDDLEKVMMVIKDTLNQVEIIGSELLELNEKNN